MSKGKQGYGSTRVALTRKQSQQIGNWSQSTQIAKEKDGVLHSFLDGATRKVKNPSITI